MIRAHVRLRDDQVSQLKRLAAERGVSMAALVREAIDHSLENDDEDAKWERALSVIGKFHSGASDVSERHDDYLADAFMEWRSRTS